MLTEQVLDAFFSNDIVSSSFLWVPVIVLIISLQLTHRHHPFVGLTSSLLWSFAAFVFCFFLLCSWTWRDGLGPGMIVSEGAEAVAKFTAALGPLFRFCALVVALGFLPIAISGFFKKRSVEIPGLKSFELPSKRMDMVCFLGPTVTAILAAMTIVVPSTNWMVEGIVAYASVCIGFALWFCAETHRLKSAARAIFLGSHVIVVGMGIGLVFWG